MSFLADWPYFYGLFALSALGCWGIGRLLLPGSLIWRQFLAGLVMISAVTSSMLWSAPLLTIPFSRAAVLAGLGVLAWQVRRDGLPTMRRPDRRVVIRAVLALVLGLAVGLRFEAWFVEIGQANYFLAPSIEFYLADYFGPLRMPGYYPWELTASHVLPSAALATLGAFLPRGTMLQSIEAWFLLISFSVARFSYLAMTRSALGIVWSAVVLGGGLLVFDQELYAGFVCSTFIYVILGLEVGVAIFLDHDRAEQSARDILFMLAIMVAAKTSILYLPGLTFLWAAARFPRQALSPPVILASLATMAQILTVMGRPKPFPDVSIKFTLANPFGGRPGLEDYYPNLGDALINQNTLSALVNQHFGIGIFAILAMVAVKYWLVPIRATDRISALYPDRREIYRIAEVFLMIAVTFWVLVRHDQHGVTHQIWAIFGTAPLVLAALLARALAVDGKWWRIGILATAAAIVAGGYHPWAGMASPSSAHLGGVTPAELMRMSPAEALIHRPGESETAYCERALLHGQRLAAGSVKLSCLGTLGILAAEPGAGK